MFTRRALLEGIALTALVLFMYALALGWSYVLCQWFGYVR